MKGKIFTLIFCTLIGVSIDLMAQDDGIGTGWGGLSPGEPLLINENFQGFDFYHNDQNADQGNSDNLLDPISGEIIYGFKNMTSKFKLPGSTDSVSYEFYQCAFAPEWSSAYAYKNQTVNTEGVSNGFVEISRFDTVYSTIPTIHGWFIVDLRKIEFVEIIQWSHSSTGGTKRGVLCEVSTDDGVTWDTLRYQPGNAWASSFTKDVTTHEKTSNEIRCYPSAYGMLWEDGIWAENIMLRFGECGGQTARIHDLKVYGTVANSSAVNELEKYQLKVYSYDKIIRVSENADVAVYNITGKLVKTGNNTNLISMKGLPDGIYIVKAQSGIRIKTTKVLIK